MKLRRNLKFRAYPTGAQALLLKRWEGILRFLWNICHEQRLAGYGRDRGCNLRKECGCDKRIFPDYYGQTKEMTELLADCPWIEDVQCQARQETLADLDKAWKRCFQKLAKQPHWKRRGDAMRIYAPCVTVEATSTGDRTTGVLTLGGPRYAPLGPIKVVFDRFTQGTVKSWTIKRELDNEWYVIACCEWEIADPKPVNDLTVGIDRGVKLFIADSTGRTVDNPRARDTLERRIARAQRQVDKKTKGSSNQKKARTKVARLLRLAARQREALIGFESLRYAKSFGTIVIEKLNINNMTKSAKGTEEEPGTHIAQKAGLNRAILDSGWGKFGEALKYKTAEQGGTVLEVNPAFTSQTCPKCGHVSPENRPDQATFCCVKCGYTANADVNAAVNIEVKGLSAPRPEPKKVKKTFHRGRKPKMVETAVKPTATLPVEDTP